MGHWEPCDCKVPVKFVKVSTLCHVLLSKFPHGYKPVLYVYVCIYVCVHVFIYLYLSSIFQYYLDIQKLKSAKNRYINVLNGID